MPGVRRKPGLFERGTPGLVVLLCYGGIFLFAINEHGGLHFMQAELLDEKWLFHAVTTRRGGVSLEPFDSLNVGLHVGDKLDHVLENRKRVCAAAGYDLQAWVSGEQVHGARCYHVKDSDAGRGAFDYTTSVPATDVLITQTPGMLLACLVADCVPVFWRIRSACRRCRTLRLAGYACRGGPGGSPNHVSSLRVNTCRFGGRSGSQHQALLL